MYFLKTENKCQCRCACFEVTCLTTLEPTGCDSNFEVKSFQDFINMQFSTMMSYLDKKHAPPAF